MNTQKKLLLHGLSWNSNKDSVQYIGTCNHTFKHSYEVIGELIHKSIHTHKIGKKLNKKKKYNWYILNLISEWNITFFPCNIGTLCCVETIYWLYFI